MKTSRGEDNFANLPAFGAKLYDMLMQSNATQMQYKEIAQDLVSRIKNGKLLDIGTGPGYLLREIHKLNLNIEIYGLDISKSMLEQAKRNLTDIKVDLKCENIKATGFESDYFDLVTCSGSFYLWVDPVAGLEEIYRILKPGGSAFLFETHRDIDKQKLWRKMKENLIGENLIRRYLSPRMFIKQLGMAYAKEEIAKIIENTSFKGCSLIEEITIVSLPVWLRVKLEKCA